MFNRSNNWGKKRIIMFQIAIKTNGHLLPFDQKTSVSKTDQSIITWDLSDDAYDLCDLFRSELARASVFNCSPLELMNKGDYHEYLMLLAEILHAIGSQFWNDPIYAYDWNQMLYKFVEDFHKLINCHFRDELKDQEFIDKINAILEYDFIPLGKSRVKSIARKTYIQQ